MTELEKRLKAADDLHSAAWLRLENLRTSVRDVKAALIKEVEERIERDYGDSMRLAREEERRLNEAVDTLRGEVALQSKKHKYAPGTILVQWKFAGGWSNRGMILTGKKGVAEVFLKGAECTVSHPPEIGSLVLRHLKADGTPGKRIEQSDYNNDFWGWYPEGVDPNKKSK